MSYVDAKLIHDSVWVSERSKEGVRKVTNVKPPYIFYYSDESGEHKSMTGVRCRRMRAWSRREFESEIDKKRKNGRLIFESDISPVYRLLETRYNTDELPPLNITLYDIETDKEPDREWATPDNPYAPITAITLYHKWLKTAITIALVPPTLTYEQASALCAQSDHEDGHGILDEAQGYYLVESEKTLLLLFLDLIEDTDILTGWNADFYDLPYIIARIRIILGGEPLAFVREDMEFEPSEKSRPYLERLSLFPCQPRLRKVENYGKLERLFDIYGRKHLDYRELYEKFVGEELHSFALDFVLQHEVKQEKVKYDGDIGSFWRNQFRKFLAYNRQDVMGMDAIDDKRKLVALANQMIHMASITFDKVTGSVAIIEQAVLKELHASFQMVAYDKVEKQADKHVPGAFVVDPKSGLYPNGANVDVDSLYPNLCITLNISPEVMIGQFDLTRTDRALESRVDDILKIPEEYRRNDHSHRSNRSEDAIDKAYSAAWKTFTGVLEYHDVVEGNETLLTLEVTNGETMTYPASKWQKLLKKNNWCVTGNGTVFDMARDGIIAFCLAKWYRERVEYQKKMDEYGKLLDEAKKAGDKEKEAEYRLLYELYDMIQNAKKLFLNSTYGAYLNRFFRFYDSRCGRSVTLSGRVVTKHMCKKTCEILVGEYDFDRRALIYGDTDSAYYSVDWFLDHNGMPKDPDTVIATADEVADQINASFTPFAVENFFIKPERCTLRAKREFVFDLGLFKDVKKRYALHVIDKKKKRVNVGDKDEIKITGLEVKRSDTPKFVQEFLRQCIEKVLRDRNEEAALSAYVDDFRAKFREMPKWKRGSPGRVSNLTDGRRQLVDYERRIERGEVLKKPTLHYLVTAAYNTNRLMERFGEKRWDVLKDGEKIEVLYLKDNDFGMGSVAIRVGETYVPDWFQQLPFDNARHEEKQITTKLDNLFGTLGWRFDPRDHYGDEFFI